MVFRRDNKGGDAFQRQISALRQQIGGDQPEDEFEDEGQLPRSQDYAPASFDDPAYEEQGVQPGNPRYEPDYQYIEETIPATSYDPQLPAIPVADPQMTVVSHNTSWKGEIISEGSMHIHGKFEGVIRADQDVFILDEATVSAEVRAQNVVIAGQYDGEVSCGNRFEVLPSGRVQGSVRAPVLVVHDGAQINGSIQMTSSEKERPEPTSLVHRREAAGSN